MIAMPEPVEREPSDQAADLQRRPIYNDLRDDYDDEYGIALSPREVARRRVMVPAVAFLVIGVLCILGAFAGAVAVVAECMSGRTPQSRLPGLLIFLWLMLVAACLFVLVMAGGVSMMRLRRRGLALTAAYIVTGLSLAGPYGILFYPFGIWALILLYRPDVREEFRRPAPLDD
jgi:cytochrome bd-type quinol oxidase subunit 2